MTKRRLLIRGVLLLILLSGGAIVNVAVACGSILSGVGLHGWRHNADGFAAGFPMASLDVDMRGMNNGDGTSLRVVQFQSTPKFLPCRPTRPGFAINTIFYAAMLWVVFFVPGKVKRTLRRRRGLCPACAYPSGAGTSLVCTECGHVLTRCRVG